MTSKFYARSHSLICTCPKTAFSAPHSTSSPHLAQTEQVRLTRFFALPDSNTPQRVTISVSGHVVVSQTGIVQVPYATVTVKYFRALKYLRTCVPTCIPTYVPTHLRAYLPTYLRTYVPTYLHAHVPACLRTYVHTYLRTCVPVYLRTYVPTYLRTYVPTCLRTCVPMYVRTY